MPRLEGELAMRHQRLRREVDARRHVVAQLPIAEAGGSPGLRALIEATDELLAFEDRLPVLLDQPARAFSVQLVRTGVVASVLGAVLVGTAVWRDLLAPAWIVALVAILVAAVRLMVLPVAPAAAGHLRQRYAAVVCGAAGLLLVPLELLLGWWAGLLALVAIGLAQVALLDRLPGRP